MYNCIVVSIRSKDEERSDVKKYAKKSNDVNKKKKILASMATTTTGYILCVWIVLLEHVNRSEGCSIIMV